jgi:hypothetical protein
MASRVVIGYDGSEASEDAVAFGLAWSRSTGDVPMIATVYPGEHAPGVGRVDAEWASYVREQAQIVQDNARAAVGDAALYRNVASTSAAHGLADLAARCARPERTTECTRSLPPVIGSTLGLTPCGPLGE